TPPRLPTRRSSDLLDQHREVPVDVLGLRHIGHEIALQRLLAGDAQNIDRTAGQGDEAHDGLEQGRLAGTVDAHQRSDGAARNGEAGMLYRGRAVAIGDGDVVNSKAGRRDVVDRKSVVK